MSEVIRRAIIELELRQKKAGGLDSSGLKRSFEEQTKAGKELEKQHISTARAAQETGRAHEEFGRRSFIAFAHAGHGVLQLSRGLALLGTSGEKDTRKLLENLVAIEAAVSLAKGAANLAHFAAEFGPVGIAVAAVGVAFTAATVLVDKFGNHTAENSEKVKKAAETMAASARRVQDEWDKAQQAIDRARASEDKVSDFAAKQRGLIKSPFERERAEDLARSGRSAAGDAEFASAGHAAAIGLTLKSRFDALRTDATPRGQRESAELADSYKRFMGEATKRQTRGAELESLNFDSVQQQRDRMLDRLGTQRSQVGNAGIGITPEQQRTLEFGDQNNRLQRQAQIETTNQAYASTARLFGAPVYTQSELNQGFASKSDEVVQAFNQLLTKMLENMKTIEAHRVEFERQATSGLTD